MKYEWNDVHEDYPEAGAELYVNGLFAGYIERIADTYAVSIQTTRGGTRIPNEPSFARARTALEAAVREAGEEG